MDDLQLSYNPLMEFKSPRSETKNKELFFEYYDMLSHPKDTDILGNWQVWVYGSDREKYPPHCHIRLADGSSEFEVSLLDWNVINIKHSKLPNSWESVGRDIENAFFTWLDRPSTQNPRETNKHYMFTFWDGANHANRLENWVSKKDNLDKDLLDYLNPSVEKIDIWKLYSDVVSKIHPIYSSKRNERYLMHRMSPNELLKCLGINVDVTTNKAALDIVFKAENEVYTWTV